MFKDTKILKIKVKDPSTDDRYDVDFEDLGLTPENAAGMDAVIIQKNQGTGVGANDDYDVEIDTENERLTIKEGSDGFGDDDEFIVALFTPIGPVTGASRAS